MNAENIALIAATLAQGKNPVRYIPEAIKLVREAENALDAPYGKPEPVKRVAFKDFLDTLDHNEKNPSRQRKRFCDFFATEIERRLKSQRMAYTDEGIASAVLANVDQFKTEGVILEDAKQWAKAFAEWRKNKVSKARSKAATAKAEQERAKELENAEEQERMNKREMRPHRGKDTMNRRRYVDEEIQPDAED